VYRILVTGLFAASLISTLRSPSLVWIIVTVVLFIVMLILWLIKFGRDTFRTG
jgi:hypothetical protein